MRYWSVDVLDAGGRLRRCVDSDLGRSVHNDCLLRNDHLPDAFSVLVLWLAVGTVASASLLVVTLLPGLVPARQSDILVVEFPQVKNLVLVRPQHFYHLNTGQPFPFVRIAQGSHCVSQQRGVPSMEVVVCRELEVVPAGDLSVEQLQVEGEVCERVELLGVEEEAGLEEREADRKGFCCRLVGSVVLRALGDKPHFLGGQVGECLFEGRLVEVGLFVGPAVQVGDLDLPLLVDEDVRRPHIAHLAADSAEVGRTAGQRVEQVPQLLLLEVLVHLDAVLDLLLEEVGVILVEDLAYGGSTLRVPAVPHRPLLRYWCFTGRRRVSLSSN